MPMGINSMTKSLAGIVGLAMVLEATDIPAIKPVMDVTTFGLPGLEIFVAPF